MDSGLSYKKFSVSGPPALLCLSESLLETLPLLLSLTTACDERSHPLDLAPGVLIFFSSHRFPILCHFFLKALPPPPPLARHPSSYPQNHFHLSCHTNIRTEFLLVRRREGRGKRRRRRSGRVRGRDKNRIFNQSKL